MKYAYNAKITREDGGYIVNFVDIENVFTKGETLEEALFNAREALEGMLEVMLQENTDIPKPDKTQKDLYSI